jgi:hypothetical protein
MNDKVVNCVMQHVTSDVFSNIFSFCLQLLKSVQVGVVHAIFDVAPEEIITGNYVS